MLNFEKRRMLILLTLRILSHKFFILSSALSVVLGINQLTLAPFFLSTYQLTLTNG